MPCPIVIGTRHTLLCWALWHHLGPGGLHVDSQAGRTSLWSDGAEGPREPREVNMPNPKVHAEIRSTGPDATRTFLGSLSRAAGQGWPDQALAGIRRGQVELHHL